MRERVIHSDAKLGDTEPHMSQTDITMYLGDHQIVHPPLHASWYEDPKFKIAIDNREFTLGTASGDGCNCLIYTMRQLLNAPPHHYGIPEDSVSRVRHSLEAYDGSSGVSPVRPGEYLDLTREWENVINLLAGFGRGLANTTTQASDQFEVVCVDLTYIGHGERLPSGHTDTHRQTLHMARINSNHFVPL